MAHNPTTKPAPTSPRPPAGEETTLQWRPGRMLAALVALAALFIGASFFVH